jgi:hypothetical protein
MILKGKKMFKKLVEAVFPVQEDYLKKLPAGADPNDYEYADDRGYFKVRTGASKIAAPHLQTCRNFIKAKKPFKKFSWKQFEVILKAVDAKSVSGWEKFDIQNIVYNPRFTKAVAYSSLKYPACWCCKWFAEEGYLAVGFWLEDDYAFLKGGKEQTVYIEASDIEKFFGKKITNTGLGSEYEAGDVVRVEAYGKKNGKDYADGYVAEITDIKGPWELSLKVWDMKKGLKDASDWGSQKYAEFYDGQRCYSTKVGTFDLSIKTLDIPNGDGRAPWCDITKNIDLSKVKKYLESGVNWSTITVNLAPRQAGVYAKIDHGFKK